MSAIDPQKMMRGLELFRQAQTMHGLGRIKEAAEAYRQATALLPNHPDLLIGYGRLAEEASDWAGAERIYRRLMAVKPVENLDGKLGMLLCNLGRYEEALPFLSSYASRHSRDAGALRHLADCCFRTERYEDGMRHADASWQQEQHADTLCLILARLIDTGARERLDTLVALALEKFPGDARIRGYAAVHLLKSGDYTRGFALLPDMRELYSPGASLKDLPVPTWTGDAFNGTLLVSAEQGLGDEIMNSSIFHELVDMGQDAVIEADARLVPVFARSFPTLRFVDRGQSHLKNLAVGPGQFRKIDGADLCKLFRRDTARFPAGRRGWLHADTAKTAVLRERYERYADGRTLIGLAWKSQRAKSIGAQKSLSLAALTPLLLRQDCAWVNLQYGDISTDISALGAAGGNLMVDPDVDTFNDIDTVFAQVAALDLVITTSTVSAHIAGALGKACWLLLPRDYTVLWYWRYSGDSTPWYPSIRIYRNTKGNDDWTTLVNEISTNITDFRASP